MIKYIRLITILVLGLTIFFVGCDNDTSTDVTDLVVATVSTPPTLDGNGNDAAWNNADELIVTVGTDAAYANAFGQVDVHLTAVKDDQNIYIKAVWEDPSNTMSVDKKQWTYDDGLWTQDGNEDRLFFFFDMGQNGDQGADCSQMCHVGEGMWTDNGIVDQWHWKAHRTAPIHHADDKYIDNNYTDSEGNVAEDAGQHGDADTTGLYNDNIDGNGLPLYSGPITDGHYLILPAGESADTYFTPFDANTVDTSTPIPGYWLDENADGSRADVTAYSSYDNGVWTVEFMRALDTGNDDDVVFGSGNIEAVVAITDDSGGSHSGSAPFTIKF